ncbi:phosphatidylserine synthase 1 [Eurytemora carolleeae]|uniref:phosphatidylserine synthase 1 n=1 Tax=Eurytemora carolleeae TaxID=1294199 RepID=UPI000C760CD5|nr:phosphatidylserine synthase 1 [Eurytemora carolleeae]|eukprot:XP_023323852.1 phosphatidylserine synthase 1-like [Eurytemora affinis]
MLYTRLIGGIMNRKRTQTEGSDASDHFVSVNERPVDDISLEFFYKPHTITLLVACISGITYTAFARDETVDYHSNLYTGLVGVSIIFLIISILTLPNGPFTRPHPAIWRCVLGMSIMYLLLLQFMIHQDWATIRSVIVWIDPKMANYSIDAEKEYGQDCWDITFERLYSHVDVFAFGHYWGWGMKALVIRHYGILWSISIMWELTEVMFGHLLPNFYECWWDNMILDVMICNGLGIFTGMQVCRFLEMREYKWESIKNIQTTTGKFKRAMLQFTPESWTHVRWLDPNSSYMRLIAIIQFILIWQVVELNTFFIKHIFPMPTEHPICVARILLNGLISAPAIRQYYTYVTDPQCKRVGTQLWVFMMIALSELILVLKFGLDIFSHTQISKMLVWLCLNIIVSVLGVFVSMEVFKWRHNKSESAPPQDEVAEDEMVSRLLNSAGEPAVRRSPRHAGKPELKVRKRNVQLPP